MGGKEDVLGNLILELRRGTIVLSVLSQLGDSKYGYSLVQSLEEKGVTVEANTLYPLLRRLEAQGLLESKWDTDEARPRKYYALTPLGREVYKKLCDEWKNMAACLGRLLDE